MFYTDDPHANWCFDTRSNRPPRAVPQPPAPPPQPRERAATAEPPPLPRIITTILDTLLPYRDAYAAVRQLLESLMRQPVPDAPG